MAKGAMRGAVVLAAVALAFGARPAAAEELTYDGATTIGKQVMTEAAPAFQAKTGVKFAKIGMSGAGKGLKAALAGEVSVAGVSRSLTPDELAQKPYFKIIGYDALGVFVNAANPVRVLTKAQLKAVYSGQVTNWKALGGADLAIVACSEKINSGRATVDAFKNMVLDGQAYGPVKELDDASDCVKFAATSKGAIAPASLAYAIQGTRALPVDGIKPTDDDVRAGTYLLARPLLLVTKSPPQGALKQFFDFMLSAEGQKFVDKSFVAVR
jgi:phosphate transport system substrate-binding protein